jgi:hypothetical protein
MPATLYAFDPFGKCRSPREVSSRAPAAGAAGVKDPRVDEHGPAIQVGAALARDVARNPTNLLAHVQRVHLWIEGRNPEETWAALLDLFIALGPRGSALRERMLRVADGVLTRECRDFLAASLPAGLDGTQPHPLAPSSVLSGWHAETLSRTSSERPSGAPDPLDEADTCLAAGKIEAARVILEAALVAEPARADLAGALLDIYRYTYDVSGLRDMRARLGTELRSTGVWDIVERDIVLSQDAKA